MLYMLQKSHHSKSNISKIVIFNFYSVNYLFPSFHTLVRLTLQLFKAYLKLCSQYHSQVSLEESHPSTKPLTFSHKLGLLGLQIQCACAIRCHDIVPRITSSIELRSQIMSCTFYIQVTTSPNYLFIKIYNTLKNS